ncbi:MtnX-like HAD-IB family phosphatase [Persephonella sp. KM09-Lau-8]|uniref:MtnX-like HAD-IB family phosphatase n=1 Tax=Persephonella sp. KM09-Lau-8 TaxID=1158345 RepID=UPI0006898128|nr:MtnX-like HAD-IB family phosphatase [Persephonella sp. KM09-Lau-8]
MSAIFFSDFDGTITEQDVIDAIMAEFAPPEYKKIQKDLFSGKIDIDIGIRQMFQLIPSHKKDEIVQWVKENIKLREGFSEFLEFLNRKNIPFVVLSGGVDLYIYPLLESYLDKIAHIYCNRISLHKEKMDVKFIYRCGEKCKRNCGICKPYIMENYYRNYSLKLYAGDGITDLDACQYSDIIFSTGQLKSMLEENMMEGKRVFKFNRFSEIIQNPIF